jgi:hypothetical protein
MFGAMDLHWLPQSKGGANGISAASAFCPASTGYQAEFAKRANDA